MAVTYPFDARPKWAEQKFNQTNEAIGAILKNPMLIAEGMAQQMSDTFEEKGAAYCVGYAAGDFVGGKGIDKIAKMSKAKIVSKSDVVDDIGDVVKLTDSGLDEVAEGMDDFNAVGTGVTTSNFGSVEKLEEHFVKHGGEFKGIYDNADDYLQGARAVIQNGTKVSYTYKGERRTGFPRFIGNNSKGIVKFEFVGTNNAGQITTYHVESGKTFWKMLNGENIQVINPLN